MLKADEIHEKNAAQHRARVGETLNELSRALNPQRIANEAMGTTSDLSQSVIHTVVGAAKRNPAGLALLALGAAVVAINPGKQTRAAVASPDYRGGEEARIAAADSKIKAKQHIRANHPVGSTSSSTMRQWLDTGLDKLSPEARDRVTKARLKVIEAQEGVERQAAKATEAAHLAHQTQPLATTLAAAGIGALIGSLIPSTRAEADLMGEKRDQLMRQAEATLRDEVDRLHAKGTDAVNSGVEAVQNELRSD
ncbi:DUF3618 domain-containing protein [Thalassorhabdomicrobium marinisediminis]|uniref:DUF3618 domain-containing protein n=1 Tax=Thalassorhabdomicrobium marinisediminis TaxID=2170577 RepID=UPI0013049696|nr:DUF3618 domain-containing protein [Thalassorhabdomicrobium marinisediminis]